MEIIVLLKRVPDTEAKILINSEGDGIREDGIKYIINPYDEYGIEEGLKLKEKVPESTVTAVCMGPEESTEVIRTALAMGADKAIHICDSSLEDADPKTAAAALAGVIRENGFDIIFCGKQGIDYDRGQTHAYLAQMLDIPQVNVITAFEISDDNSTVTLERRIEGGNEMVEAKLPAIISCEKGLNEPRYASLPGIMKAKKKEISKMTAADIGVESITEDIKILKWLPLPKSGECRMIEGEETADQVSELVKLLREEAKVI
ncbi:MAG: electron transfer flavoprotein subunit beta [Candidatus Latescibacteria bacterium]|nr:electron transfer flavoprotein subunit beta [bacterium]MBD3423591.1 electron transfer flavoprotein subunit beta [Candidatus Latescibacterota bacterium]